MTRGLDVARGPRLPEEQMRREQQDVRTLWADATGFTPQEVVEMALGCAKKVPEDGSASIAAAFEA